MLIAFFSSLNLIDSPSNPLTYKTPECTAAVLTIVFHLNNLFMGKNDIIGFQ